MHPNQENIFSTPVWGFLLKEQRHQNADYTDYILNLQEKGYSQYRKSNRGGFQSEDNLHTHGIFQEFNSSILSVCQSILPDKQIYLQSMWANVNEQHHFNLPHVHEGVLSGVFYCKIPEDSGKLVLMDPAIRSTAHLIGNKNFFIEPKPLALIIFPSWLEHYVEPNKSEELRVSISFNIGIKEL